MLSFSKKSGPTKPVDESVNRIDSDFVKIFISAILAALLMFGYTYSHAYFAVFGISFYQLEMTPLDVYFRGAFVFTGTKEFIVGVSFFSVFSIVFALALRANAFVAFLVLTLAICSAGYFTISFGAKIGLKHALDFSEHGNGDRAICQLKDTPTGPSEIAMAIEKFSLEGILRYTAQNSINTYLSVYVKDSLEKGLIGQSYVIPNEDIEFCRILASG